MINKFHPYHIVTRRPWPIMSSLAAWGAVSTTATIIAGKINTLVAKAFIITIVIASSIWWVDTIKERKKEGEHQEKVSIGLKIGIILFITSEVMFFSRFFWAYFHRGIRPNIEVGQVWPPNEIKSFDPTNVPLLNTLILISSGVSVTWAHHATIKNEQKKREKGLILTCALGLYFSLLQWMEYKQGEFSIGDSSYGSVFFIATGFHGIHVIIGTTFLVVTLINITIMSISKRHHNSFEIAAWYWHFVDVVWLFLYLSIYWWGK